MNSTHKPERGSRLLRLIQCAGAFCAVVLIMFIMYAVMGFSPFGTLSLASGDANIQYLDFFAYLKDVFAGENSIVYTFSKGLGGTGIALFGYYLASPFSLLVIFFQKSNLVAYFDLAVALKLGTASLTMCYFLQERFHCRLNTCFLLILSVSYAMMQYCIAQCHNILWLDGVYMLPLMMLGIYRIVNGRRPYFLIISTGLSLLFNWYSGGINCLYSVIWFCLEWVLALPGNNVKSRAFLIDTLKTIGAYAGSMVCGVLVSAGLLLPTLMALSAGGRGTIDWSILNFSLTGNVANVFQSFTIASYSSEGNVSLFCGSFVLLGCICFFTSRNHSWVKKIKIAVFLILSVMLCYWQPFFVLFSLLKSATSSWYRYSYVADFLLVFIAGVYYSHISLEKSAVVSFIRNACAYIVVLVICAMIWPLWSMRNTLLTCILSALTAGAAANFAYIYYSRSGGIRKTAVRGAAAAILIVVFLSELVINDNLLMRGYSVDNASQYRDYSAAQQEQIDVLQAYDAGTYRINQTSTYNMKEQTNLTANYNEALAYNYRSVSSYTSDPDERQRQLLNALGYRICGENMCITDTSVLAADSLLGVKYVLSSYPVNGLQKVDDLGTYNGKDVYYNPYALPPALVYDSSADDSAAQSLNPFEYQNYLYSLLLGEDAELYTPLDYTMEDSGSEKVYTLFIPDGSCAVYGNIPWKSYADAVLSVNGTYEIAYACWMCPSVFYIPTEAGDDSAEVRLQYETDTLKDAQFYILNLDELKRVTELLNAGAAENAEFRNGSVRIETTADSGENLLVSVPYGDGWTITRNGETIEPELFADCLYSIPLESGNNIIEMNYHIPYLFVGLILSGITILALILVFAWRRIRR